MVLAGACVRRNHGSVDSEVCYQGQTRFLGYLAAVASIPFLAIPKLTVAVLFGSQWTSVVPLMPLMALIVWGHALASLTRWHYVVENENTKYRNWSALSAVVQVVVILLLSGTTVYHMAVAFSLVTLVTGLGGVLLSCQITGQSFISAIRPFFYPLCI